MKIDIIHGDYWVGVYLDDKLVHEDHKITASQILNLLNIPSTSREVDLDWLDERGELPELLSEIPGDKLGRPY